jgi:hypothetical protein
MTKRTREEAILRTYPTPGAYGRDPDSKLPKAKTARYANPRAEGAALPACSASWKDAPEYIPEQRTPLRPGSEDFLKLPSRTNDERYYPLTKERK